MPAGATINSFTIEYRMADSSDDPHKKQVDGSIRKTRLDSLTMGITYEFKIKMNMGKWHDSQLSSGVRVRTLEDQTDLQKLEGTLKASFDAKIKALDNKMVTADQATANRINQAAEEKVASLQTTLQNSLTSLSSKVTNSMQTAGLNCVGSHGVRSRCCTQDKPCDIGGGDCDHDNQCLHGLVCGTNNCKYFDNATPSGEDCCEDRTSRCRGTSYESPTTCCTARSPCPVGGGDCDGPQDCEPGLVCGFDNCKNDFRSTSSNSGDCCTVYFEGVRVSTS